MKRPATSGVWITDVSFVPAAPADVAHGLLGWVAFELDGTWRVDGVTLRRARRGRLALSFPSRIDRFGFEHAFLRPTCDRARRAIERAVLAELGLVKAAPALGGGRRRRRSRPARGGRR